MFRRGGTFRDLFFYSPDEFVHPYLILLSRLTFWQIGIPHTHTHTHTTWWHWYNSYHQPWKVIPLIHTYTYARETLGGVKQYSENLGEFLRGDKIENSAYQVRRFLRTSVSKNCSKYGYNSWIQTLLKEFWILLFDLCWLLHYRENWNLCGQCLIYRFYIIQ